MAKVVESNLIVNKIWKPGKCLSSQNDPERQYGLTIVGFVKAECVFLYNKWFIHYYVTQFKTIFDPTSPDRHAFFITKALELPSPSP